MNRTLNFKLLVDYCLFLLVRLFEEIFCMIPESWALATGRFLGRCAFVLIPDRREAAVENLTIAFGKEQSDQWIRRTARKSFEHLGMLGIEFFRIRRWDQDEMDRRIEYEGRTAYNLAMLPGNHGILLLNSHFGCFEVSAATVKFMGMKLNLIMSPSKNPFLSQYLFSRGGDETGVTTYRDKGVIPDMIQGLRDGEMLAVLGDQRGDAERGIFVDYFGTSAPANEVFARLAIDGQARILPLCTYRRDDGRYQSIFWDEICLELTGDRKTDLITVSKQFHNMFEKWLRIRPEQGFWVQRKWRRKPSHRRSQQLAAMPGKTEIQN
jgi:KDO2-lipid IV(A) lauroyltransferase